MQNTILVGSVGSVGSFSRNDPTFHDEVGSHNSLYLLK